MNHLMEKRVISYMNEFTEAIKNCKDVVEYYELVMSVLMFQKLICAQFKELYEMDSKDVNETLVVLNANAESYVNEVVKRHKQTETFSLPLEKGELN